MKEVFWFVKIIIITAIIEEIDAINSSLNINFFQKTKTTSNIYVLINHKKIKCINILYGI